MHFRDFLLLEYDESNFEEFVRMQDNPLKESMYKIESGKPVSFKHPETGEHRVLSEHGKTLVHSLYHAMENTINRDEFIPTVKRIYEHNKERGLKSISDGAHLFKGTTLGMNLFHMHMGLETPELKNAMVSEALPYIHSISHPLALQGMSNAMEKMGESVDTNGADAHEPYIAQMKAFHPVKTQDGKYLHLSVDHDDDQYDYGQD